MNNLNKFWVGVDIFQSYDLTCSIVIMKSRYEAYYIKKLPKKDKKSLEAAGWKRDQAEDKWVLIKK